MPNPRFYPSQSRRSPEDDRVEKLAALAQIMNSFQAPQMRQQEEQKRNALAVLGMMMQQQQQQEQAKMQQGHYDAVLGQQKAVEDKRSGEFWNGEMPLKWAQEANQQKHLEAAKEAEKQAALRTVLAQVGSMPGTTPQGYLQTAADLGVPNADIAVKHGMESVANAQASRLASILGSVYGQFSEKPRQAQQALDMLWQAEPGMQDSAVLERLQPRIDSWNAALAQPGAVADSTQRSGGLVDAVNPFHPNDDLMAGLAKINAARKAKLTPQELYNDQHPLDSIWNSLFGNPVTR